jgi:hypothetical protein
VTATYWSSPIKRVERRVAVEVMLVTMVNRKQKGDSGRKDGTVRWSRLSGVRRNREKRLEILRLRMNLKMSNINCQNWGEYKYICLYLLLRVLNLLLLKNNATRTELRIVPKMKVMKMIISRITVKMRSPLSSSLDLLVMVTPGAFWKC